MRLVIDGKGTTLSIAANDVIPTVSAVGISLLVMLLLCASCGPSADRVPSPASPGSVDAGPSPGEQPRRCNGSKVGCDRSYPLSPTVMTHNALASEADGFVAPNQRHGVLRQLEDGVRGLMLDTYYHEETVTLCHGSCALGNTPLLTTLTEIAGFLTDRPDVVLTLVFESYVSAADTSAVFLQAGLESFLYAHPGGIWPTLGELIDSGQRLVVFTDHEGGNPPWYHDVWAWAWDTHFHAETLEDLNCDLGRGAVANPIFILNHFLTAPIGLESLAETANARETLLDRANRCAARHGRPPTFLVVDFYSIGDAFDVAGVIEETDMP